MAIQLTISNQRLLRKTAKQRLIKRRKPKAEIDQTPNATDEEGSSKAKVDEAVTAINAIDQVTNNAGVAPRNQMV